MNSKTHPPLAAAAAAALLLSMAPTASGSVRLDSSPTGPRASAPSTGSATAGKIEFYLPYWTLRANQQTVAHVAYPRDDPLDSWVGHRVEVQVQKSDGSWRTVGRARQRPDPEKRETRTRIDYRVPIDGRVKTRVKAHSKSSTMTSKVRTLHIDFQTPPYAPTALPATVRWCWYPSIAGGPSRIAYQCPIKHGDSSWLHQPDTGKRELLAPRSEQPELAADAPVAIAEKQPERAQNMERDRVRRYNLRTGRSRWIAYKRNGKRAQIATFASLSADGDRVAYASPSRGITRNAPKGWNVYVARAGSKKSRYVGRGKDCSISASGRFVVWRTPEDAVRRHDLRKDHTTPVTKSEQLHPKKPDAASPEISANGRYVTFSAAKGPWRKVVRFYDAKRGEMRTLATAESPTMSDDGRYVAYQLDDARGNLFVWDRKTDTTELISVGRNGDGVLSGPYVPDMSPNGRWIVAVTVSNEVAPDNDDGHGGQKHSIVLFDRNAAPE